MPTLDVPGASLYYETDGHVSKPALLLIHAGVATLRMWDPLVPALADDHFVIRYDTRGFGQTMTENVEYSDRADAIDLLDHLGVKRATVIGASRGGQIAIDLAVDSPARVTGLVVVGSGPGGFPETELTEAEDAAFDEQDAAYRARDWQRLARLEASFWAVGPTRNEADLDPAFIARAYELNAPNAAHGGESPVHSDLDPPAYERVTDITVPTLVTVGESDISETLVQYEYLATTIPNASSAVFPDTAHLPSVERPDDFQAVLQGWLAENGL